MVPPPDRAPAKAVSVLLVAEENAAAQRAKDLLFAGNGCLTAFDVTVAESPQDALRVVEDAGRPVDAIVFALSSAAAFRIETLDAIQTRAPQIPVIVTGPAGNREFVLGLLKRGAQDFLPEPSLTPDTLARSIVFSIERKAGQVPAGALNSALRDAEEKLSAMQLHLVEAKKLESLGRMASGVAHEVKNPLGMLQMGVDYFTQRHDPKDAVSELILKRMGEAIERADGIIRDMVDFSRSGDLVLRDDDLNAVLEAALSLTHHDLTRGKINVKTDFARPLPAVRVDRAKIEQVFVNLITNAIHAMPEGGDLEIRTRWEAIDDIARDQGLRSLEHLRAGDRVVVVDVRDYGSGIPEEKLEVVFDPFYTTKPTGVGKGLGLAVAKAIVDLHRGMIRIRNVKPRGVLVQAIFKAYGNTTAERKDLPSGVQRA